MAKGKYRGLRPTRTIYVQCSNCGRIDESKVKFLNIQEDMQGRDLMTFECPTCKSEQTSYRFG